MQEQLISFETAKLAKEKEFNEKCLYHYYTGVTKGTKAGELFHETYISNACPNSHWKAGVCTAPSQSLLQKWLREAHDIKVFIDYQMISSDDYEYCYKIMYEEGDAKRQCERTIIIESLNHYGSGYVNTIPNNTYEEVLETALQEALKLIK